MDDLKTIQSLKLSIIIPVYNIEAYIGQCLESVFAQELSNYEVICVNDGSTDKSQSIIESYASKHSNLHYIIQPNGGLSDARNTGIANAHGDYIFFLDGDDTLATTNALQYPLNVCIQNNLDLYVGNAIVNGSYPYLSNYPTENKVISGENMMGLFFEHNHTIIEPVWCYLYKKEFLDNYQLRFKKGILHEDILFSPKTLFQAQRCMCKDISIVNYRWQRPGAITSQKTIKGFSDRRDTGRELYTWFSKKTSTDIPYQIIFSIYTELILSIVKAGIRPSIILDYTDYDIMQQCRRTSRDRKCYRLAHINPILMVRYLENTMPPIIRKAINRFL